MVSAISIKPKMERWLKISKFIKVVHYINRIHEKNYMLIMIGPEKRSDKIYHLLLVKTLKLEWHETLLTWEGTFFKN